MKRLLLLLALCSFNVNAQQIDSVPLNDTSINLRFPLWDVADPKKCATDITSSTSGLEINVSTDNTDGYYDQFRQSDSTLEAIATIGTYATPTATKARLEIIVAGSCIYELQLPNAAFAIAGSTQLNIEITDSSGQIIDHYYWVDLKIIAAATVVDLIWDEAGADHVAADSTGAQLETKMDAVLVDTGTTLDGKLDATVTNSKRNYLYTAAITTVTSQTVFVVDSQDDPGATDQHVRRFLCVEDADDALNQDCARITDFNTSTDSWTISASLVFTVEVGDTIYIPASAPQIPRY